MRSIHQLVSSALVAGSVLAAVSSQANAAVISATSSGYGLDAHVQALGLNVDAGPLPTGVSGSAPAPYSLNQNTLNVNVTGNIPVVVGGSITANSVSGTAVSNVDGLLGSRITSASGGVVGAGVNVNTLPIIGPGINLLGLNGTLFSNASISGDVGSLTATGSTTIQSLNLTINGIAVDLSSFVGASVAPNTSVNLAALGIANASLILNEQVIAPDHSSISVNALHLTTNIANLITSNVVMGHSQVSMVAAVVPEPASLSMLGLGAVALRRRR